MLSQLSATLDATVTPERKQTYLRVLEALAVVNFEAHIEELESYFAFAHNPDATELVETLDSVLGTALSTCLSEYGLILVHETPMDVSADILTATITLDNYSDSASILDALQIADSPESVLCDLLQLTGQRPAIEYLPYIQHVSVALLERIESIHAKTDQDTERRASNASVERLKMMSIEGTQLEAWINDGLLVGMSLGQYVERFDRVEKELSNEELAREVLAMLLASSLNEERYDAAASELIESYARDIHRAMDSIAHYRRLKSEVFRA